MRKSKNSSINKKSFRERERESPVALSVCWTRIYHLVSLVKGEETRRLLKKRRKKMMKSGRNTFSLNFTIQL